ncbi:hypothetical protein [Nitrosomonas sp. ANs5]|uniref:hypothetical protein n=1 Tax=Nitrosomonas sp. ANs5 TaxID=3423941 RepID=UPI003D34FF34
MGLPNGYLRRQRGQVANKEKLAHRSQIDSEQYPFTCMHYIGLNPLRAGLVTYPAAYAVIISGSLRAQRTNPGVGRTYAPDLLRKVVDWRRPGFDGA